jgi:N-acetyl-anhydromuramyl-L-alanine amidase AmpD
MSFPFVNDQPAEQNQAGATPASVTANPAPTTDTAAPPQTEFNASLQPGAYKIEWKGSPNFWSGRDGQTAIAICDHIMQGNMDSTNGWFKNRRSDASSHFGVGRDGRIWQWVRVEDIAWANGIMQGPDT